MSEHSLTTPPGLLLATDLSARCDRPLERAKQLAGQFHSLLTVLTVHDAPQAPLEVTGWLDGDIGLERAEHAFMKQANNKGRVLESFEILTLTGWKD